MELLFGKFPALGLTYLKSIISEAFSVGQKNRLDVRAQPVAQPDRINMSYFSESWGGGLAFTLGTKKNKGGVLI